MKKSIFDIQLIQREWDVDVLIVMSLAIYWLVAASKNKFGVYFENNE